MSKLDFSSLQKALRRLDTRYERAPHVYRAEYIVDNGDGTHDVYVLDPSGERGARRTVRGRVGGWAGVHVRLAHDERRFGPKELVIVGPDEIGYGAEAAPSMLELHGPRHGYNEIDEVMNLYTWQFYPLRVQPTDPTTMSVTVIAGIYYAGGSYHLLTPSQTVDLTAHKPGSGYAYVTLSVDSTGTINVTVGSTVTVPTVEDIPDPPAGEQPLGAVLLGAAKSTVERGDCVVDLRWTSIISGGGTIWENVLIVAKSGGQHTTISAALSAASSGYTIFVMPGTYTEDITLVDGVQVVGLSRGDLNAVRIDGKIVVSSGVTAALYNLDVWEETGISSVSMSVSVGQIAVALDVGHVDAKISAINCGFWAEQNDVGADAYGVRCSAGEVWLWHCEIGSNAWGADTSYGVAATGGIIHCRASDIGRNGNCDYDLYRATGTLYDEWNTYDVTKKLGTITYPQRGVRTLTSEANVSNPPTVAELNSAFGTATAVGDGFTAWVNDNGGDTSFFIVGAVGGNWVSVTATKLS